MSVSETIRLTELTGMMIAYFPPFESMGMCHVDGCLVPGLGPPSSPLALRLTRLSMSQNGRYFEYTVNTAVCDFFSRFLDLFSTSQTISTLPQKDRDIPSTSQMISTLPQNDRDISYISTVWRAP